MSKFIELSEYNFPFIQNMKQILFLEIGENEGPFGV